MENNSNTGQSNLNTKHSLLSAQADLNTGTVFHNDAIPPRPVNTPVSQPIAPKPLPQSVQDAADEFRKRMEAEKAKSVSALQSTVDALSPNHSTSVPPKIASVQLEHAESTKPLNNPFVGMSMQKPAQHAVPAGNEVVFDSDPSLSQTVPVSNKSHSVILIVSVLVILGLLAGGIFYWYTYMGGKDLVQSRLGNAKNTTEGMEKAPGVPKPAQTFPAVVRTATTTPPTPTKPQVVNSNVFAPAKTTTITPKKTATFGDAEKEIVSSYITTNINKLSRVKSATGFSVEDVRFDGPNIALVSYGDGDLSVSAVLNFTYTNGTVKVNSFSILEK